MAMRKNSYYPLMIGLLMVSLFNACEKEESKQYQELSGFVYFAQTTIPVSGVTLTIDDLSAISDSNGRYRLSGVTEGSHELVAIKDGFDGISVSLQFNNNSNNYNVEMTSNIYTQKLFGMVNVSGNPLELCEIIVLNPDGSESNLKTQTSSTGAFSLHTVPQGKRTIRLKHVDYELTATEIHISDSDYEQNFSMDKILPTVSTERIEAFYQSADLKRTVSDGGNSPVIASGVCWNTSEYPTTSDYKTIEQTGIGNFTSQPGGLLPGTTYYLRTYATNAEGTSYGDQLVFTTKDFPKVGDSYGGGVLAYILQPGDPGFDPHEIHGLIATPSDQGVAQWGCFGSTLEGTSTDLGSGAENTRKILASCNQDGIAAKICDDLVLDGFTDWYLPSLDELHKLFLNRQAIGNFPDEGYYWSSSAASSINAWPHSFCAGSRSSYPRTVEKRVRAVRSF